MRVLITGCSSGFGLGAARLLAERGDVVYATVRDLERATELVAARGGGLPISILPLDVRDAQRAEEVVRQIVDEGGIDGLVNNAGVSMYAAMEESSIDQARAMMETNYFGPLRLIKLVLPHMRRQGHGRIVNVSSGAGYMPVPYVSTYTATKHALDGMTFCLAVELAPFGVKFSVISPGGYNTAVGGNLWEPDALTDEPHYRETAARALARWWQHVSNRDPIEVAQAIVDALHEEDPPLRRFVGDDLEREIKAFRALGDDEWLARQLALRTNEPAT